MASRSRTRRDKLQEHCNELGMASFDAGDTNLEIEARILKEGSRYAEEGLSDALVGFLRRKRREE